MKTEIIKAEDYGLKASKANELTKGLNVVKAERELLIKEFESVSKLELIQENLPAFRTLRLAIVKNRTQGIDKWHKTNKEFFLTGGKFVDAIKNKEKAINEEMEEKLMNAEKHFENLEKERVAKLQAERVALISEFTEHASAIDLAGMEDDVWEAYFSTKKQAHIDKLKEEEEERKRLEAEIKAREEEQARIKKENEKLKAEAEKREAREKKERAEHEAKLKKERAQHEAKLKAEREAREKIEEEEGLKREKLERELKAKEEAEAKAIADEEQRIQDELNKGDKAKVEDLINDLEALKTKYTFKAKNNKKMYRDVGMLLDKVINHI